MFSKTLKVLTVGFFSLTLISLSSPTMATDVIRIEVGSEQPKQSRRDLLKRIKRLERAVAQLQDQVFQLNQNSAATKKSWTCIATAFGKTFTHTAGSEMEAKAKTLKKCTKDNNKMHCSVECGS